MTDSESTSHGLFRAAFEHRKALIRFAQNYVRDQAVSEDIVMDSFMYCWQNRDSSSICTTNELLAYTLTVVKHKCLDHIKLQKRRREILDESNSSALWDLNMSIQSLEALEPTKIYTRENIELARRLLNRLPEKTRRIFMLSYHDCMTYSEIAYSENLSVKTIEYHISKALRMMREHLDRMGPLSLLIFTLID